MITLGDYTITIMVDMTEKDPNYAREAEKYNNPIPSREFILEPRQS